MRTGLLAVFAVVLLAFAGFAFALELNQSKPCRYIDADGYAVLDSSLTVYGLPTAYTIYGADATDEFWVRRNIGGTWETGPGALIPAGQSLLIPAPQPTQSVSGSGYYVHFVQFGGLADSCFVIPWVQ